MGRYLDPKSDIVFKKIFYDHPSLLISFLNAVLPLGDDEQIVELTYLVNEQFPSIPGFKRTIVDVKCKDQAGQIFIVEMQIDRQESFMQRLLFGTAQAYVNQLEAGESYELLNPVYGLGILNNTFDSSPDWYHHYSLVKVNEPKQRIIDGLTLVFVELPKCPIKTPERKKLKILWLRFLREIGEKTDEVDPALLDVPEIKQAIEYTKEAGYTPSELDTYQSYWRAVSAEKTLRNKSLAKGIAIGKEEGKIEGIAIGKEEGIAIGKEEGKAEGIAIGKEEAKAEITRLTAKKMKLEGLPLEMIVKCTGLSRKDIDQL